MIGKIREFIGLFLIVTIFSVALTQGVFSLSLSPLQIILSVLVVILGNLGCLMVLSKDSSSKVIKDSPLDKLIEKPILKMATLIGLWLLEFVIAFGIVGSGNSKLFIALLLPCLFSGIILSSKRS